VVGRPLETAELADEELVERAKRGDVHAYELLVKRYQPIAFRVAYVLAGSAEDAEEAAQDGFIKAYRALDRFRPGAPWRPWLLRIVGNEARNRRRASTRHAELVLRAAREVPSGEAAPSPEGVALASAERTTLLAALARLRERDRRVLACRYLLDLSEGEIAAVLGCRRGTVKSRLSRALARLRTELEAEGRHG
jgi:RNA polymerase sigma factor (sigma-70 family)